jgi:nucleoid-associated protein YgaU
MTIPGSTWQPSKSPGGSRPQSGIVTAGPGRIVLKNKKKNEVVDFQYNPASLTIMQTAKVESKGYIAGSAEQQVTKLDDFNITLSDLRLEGKQEIAKIDILYRWLRPMPIIGAHRVPPATAKVTPSAGTPATPSGGAAKKVSGGAGKGKISIHDVQIITYTWGKTSYDTILKSVNTTYTRFNHDGDPIRAKVSLTLTKYNLPLPGTNPSSGGEPGGRVHLVTDGDTLQRIAQATYGDPGAWRDVAAANNIDDPLRVRNGSSLFLPGATVD